MKNYIPKTKGDMQAVKTLKKLPFESIKADVPALLEWMQDINWPVAGGIVRYLAPHVNEIKESLLNILKSNDDDTWKYSIIAFLIANSKAKLDLELISMIKRIADHPTASEIREEVDEVAKRVMANYK